VCRAEFATHGRPEIDGDDYGEVDEALFGEIVARRRATATVDEAFAARQRGWPWHAGTILRVVLEPALRIMHRQNIPAGDDEDMSASARVL